MECILSRTCGTAVASNLKESNHWVVNFMRRFNTSLLLKNTEKNLSGEQRIPKLKRWHDRFRRRPIRQKTGLHFDHNGVEHCHKTETLLTRLHAISRKDTHYI